MTIQDRILEYLVKGHKLTARKCDKKFGTLRLGAYICNLRKEGYNIISETKKGKNRYGDKISWSEYHLENNNKI